MIFNQKKVIFDDRINYELFVINSFYNSNKSIKLCRKFLTFTHYNKSKNIENIYKKECKVISKFNKYNRKILVAVHSHISLFYQRHVLRKIYKIYKNIQLLFFVGLDYNRTLNTILKEEISTYNDIILFEFYSNYKNLQYLTYNFVLWVKKYRYLYNIIIKQDTDTFLNVFLLEKILLNMKNKTNYVIGHIWHYKRKGREFPSGMAYIFPSQSVEKLTENIQQKYLKFVYGYPEDKLFGYLAREANFTFYDSYHDFNYRCFLQIPTNIMNINNIFMIHSLRISEIAFLNYVVSNITIFNFNNTI